MSNKGMLEAGRSTFAVRSTKRTAGPQECFLEGKQQVVGVSGKIGKSRMGTGQRSYSIKSTVEVVWERQVVHVMGLHTHVGTRVWVARVRVRV